MSAGLQSASSVRPWGSADGPLWCPYKCVCVVHACRAGVESLILRQHSPAEMAVCAVMWMPWPLPNMNIVIEAVGTEVLEARGGFLITLATPTDEEVRARGAPLAPRWTGNAPGVWR